jgi:cytoskeleton protein RodZ
MNETANEKSEDESTGPLCGERLRAARRENDISIRDIAKELHLDESKVRALEENNFALLGAPVFAKGHMRKYAVLVGVDIDDVLADYYQLERSTGAPPVVGPKRKVPREISMGPWIAVIVVAVIVGGTAYWWFNREPADPGSAKVEPATLAPFASDSDIDPVPEEEPQAATGNAEVLDSQSADDPGAEELPTVENEEVQIEPAVTVQEPVNSAPSSLPQVRVELTYTGDCWTEVSDASGKRLFYDLGAAGRVVPLRGDAPLRIVLGDSANVSITVEGRDYQIPNSARSGRLARLTINRP